MLTPSNALSFLRAPLAILFLFESVYVRVCVVCVAMITDFVDGYLARRYKQVSRFGAVLDPLMDKFFVFFIVITLFYEGSLAGWEVLAMVSRDFAILTFAFFLFWQNRWQKYSLKAVLWSKITTALQFLIILLLACNLTPPPLIFFGFFGLGLFVLYELFATFDATTT